MYSVSLLRDATQMATIQRIKLSAEVLGFNPLEGDSSREYCMLLCHEHDLTLEWLMNGDLSTLESRCQDLIRPLLDTSLIEPIFKQSHIGQWSENSQHRLIKLSIWHKDLITDLRIRINPIGHTRWELCDESADEPHWQLYRELATNGIAFDDFRFSKIPKNGVRKWFSINYTPLMAGKLFMGGYGTTRRIRCPTTSGLFGKRSSAA